MTDPDARSNGQNGSDGGVSSGLDRWVPKGALSGFLVQGAAFAFVAQLLAIFSGIASQVFLARLLTPDVLGIYFLTQSFVIISANVGEFGLNRPISRMISTQVGAGQPGAALRVLRSATGIAAVSMSIVIALFLGGLGRWLALTLFDSMLMASCVALTSLWIAGRIVLNTSAAVLQGLHRVGLSAFFGGASSGVVVAVICGVLLWMGADVDYATVVVITTGATLTSALFCVAIAWSPFIGIRPSGPARTRALVVSTLPIFAAGVLQVAAIQGDLWIVGALLEPSDVALYGAGKRLTVLVGFPLMVLSVVVPPLISDLYARDEHGRLQRLLRGAATVASIPALAAFVVFMIFAPEILTLTYGEAYAEAATIVRILCAERLAFILMGPGMLLLIMTGHERVVFRITMVSATTSLLAIYLGGQLAGFVGVAIGFSCASSATGLLYLLEARRRTGIWAHANPFSVKPITEVVQRMMRPRA